MTVFYQFYQLTTASGERPPIHCHKAPNLPTIRNQKNRCLSKKKFITGFRGFQSEWSQFCTRFPGVQSLCLAINHNRVDVIILAKIADPIKSARCRDLMSWTQITTLGPLRNVSKRGYALSQPVIKPRRKWSLGWNQQNAARNNRQL